MKELDFNQITEGSSFIVQGDNKAGKMTFAFYMIQSLFKEKALLFTPQESYLFQRRIDALKGQFTQFNNIDELLTPYFLKEDYKVLKQRYGFDFLIKEFVYIISQAEEKVIIVHRFGELFEFQDRYEIEEVYKALTKVCHSYDKKLVFVVNEQGENFDQISNIADEFADISIKIDVDDANQRFVHIRDVIHNREYPLLSFALHANSFLLDYHVSQEQESVEHIKNVLICELDYAHDNLVEICRYIFDKPGFQTKHATSLQSILQEVFISPDIIIVLMKRTEANLETIKAIKMNLPESPVIAILDQDFVRAEDAQQAYSYGIEELFSRNLVLDQLILATQKAAKTLYYTKALEELPKLSNKIKDIVTMREFVSECVQRSIFFTLFVFQKGEDALEAQRPSRQYDFVHESDEKIYYIALNTAPKDAQKIIEKYNNSKLICMWEPINHTKVEDCLK